MYACVPRPTTMTHHFMYDCVPRPTTMTHHFMYDCVPRPTTMAHHCMYDCVPRPTTMAHHCMYDCVPRPTTMTGKRNGLVRCGSPCTRPVSLKFLYNTSPLFSKMAQNLDLRCVLILDPSILCAGAKTRLESRIKKFTPHCVCRPLCVRHISPACALLYCMCPIVCALFYCMCPILLYCMCPILLYGTKPPFYQLKLPTSEL